MYDLERIICDFVIHREKIDSELFAKKNLNIIENILKNITNFYESATKMNTLDKVKQTLEILV